MSNTYTQIHIHFVFAVKYRLALIDKKWQEELYKYITGIIQNNNHKLLIINGVADHVHLLIGMRPTQSISDLMKDTKQFSSKWINDNKKTKSRFEWQEGYGAFSIGTSDIDRVAKYISNQEEHHKTTTFKTEYLKLLQDYNVEYEEKYIFKEPE
jgi:putative transposase